MLNYQKENTLKILDILIQVNSMLNILKHKNIQKGNANKFSIILLSWELLKKMYIYIFC